MAGFWNVLHMIFLKLYFYLYLWTITFALLWFKTNLKHSYFRVKFLLLLQVAKLIGKLACFSDYFGMLRMSSRSCIIRLVSSYNLNCMSSGNIKRQLLMKPWLEMSVKGVILTIYYWKTHLKTYEQNMFVLITYLFT